MDYALTDQILDLLAEGKKEYGFLALRGEYEAEGSNDEDILQLSDLAKKVGLSLCVKIGGCEAIRDLKKAKEFGSDMILAPMIETPYALRKYIDSIKKIYANNEIEITKFLFNIETITGYKNLKYIIDEAKTVPFLSAIVLGRVDFVQSMELKRSDIESEAAFAYCESIAKQCVSNNISFSMGGGISEKSIKNLLEISKINLVNFETRKIVFDAKIVNTKKSIHAIKLANKFELLWLKSKHSNDFQVQERIALLESRI